MLPNTSSKFAICPYCQHEHTLDLSNKIHHAVAVCSSCKKKFFLDISFVARIMTVPDCEVNDESHEFDEWVSDTTDMNHRLCKKCGMYELSKKENKNDASVQGESASD